MNPYEHSTVLPPEPDKAGRMFFPSIAAGVVGAAIWICLIVGVYVILPRFRTIIVGFGTDIPALTTFVMDYAGLLLPLIGIAAGASLAAMQSRRLQVFVLIWLPMILMVVLALTVGQSFVKPLTDLAERDVPYLPPLPEKCSIASASIVGCFETATTETRKALATKSERGPESYLENRMEAHSNGKTASQPSIVLNRLSVNQNFR